MKKLILGLLSCALMFSSCKKEEAIDYMAKDIETIKQYLADNNINATQLPSGVFVSISEQGPSNLKPDINSQVTVFYKGYFFDGNVFDESWPTATNPARREPIEFPLGDVIQGWQIGMQEFSEGSKGSLFIPSPLAYGSRGSGAIRPNTPIIFDIELLSVN